MSKKKYPPLTCVVDRFEGHFAVLIFNLTKTSQELIIPRRYLPLEAKEGNILQLEFFTDNMSKLKNENLAKLVLEEILKGGK